MTGFQIASSVALVVLLVFLVLLAFRSLRQQRGSQMHRTAEEDRQLGHGAITTTDGAGSARPLKNGRR